MLNKHISVYSFNNLILLSIYFPKYLIIIYAVNWDNQIRLNFKICF